MFYWPSAVLLLLLRRAAAAGGGAERHHKDKISSLIFAIAKPGLRFFGQVFEQFIIV
jgi:hypothetical protein